MRTSAAAVGVLILALLATPVGTWAQDALTLEVMPQAACDQVVFGIFIEGGVPPYVVSVDYGDGVVEVGAPEDVSSHVYVADGEYRWSLTVTDAAEQEVSADGTFRLALPSVSLTSEPFPPLLTLIDGEAEATFTAVVEGGTEPYTYQWGLDGDAAPDAGLTAPTVARSYVQAGEYQTGVKVTDALGCGASDALAVIVIDPEDDPETACHPTALRIAEAVSALFPTQAEQTYTCEDILAIFNGEVFGFQVGFGRMWHAYQLTQVIEGLTWEQLRDWHLDSGGWGALVQLDRFAGLLETHGILDLMELVASEDYTLADIRSAVRAVTRYDADFEDALARLDEGVSAGELGQFYRLAQELGEDPDALDGYLDEGFSLAEVRHASGLAERLGMTWTGMMDLRGYGHSWGEIGQAFRLADEEHSAEDILAMGVQEFRAARREQDQGSREADRNAHVAERLAGQFGAEAGEVIGLFNGECAQSWGCVRETLRGRLQDASRRDDRSAGQIAAKYGISVEEVMGVLNGACAGDWSCARDHFRDLSRGERGRGNSD